MVLKPLAANADSSIRCNFESDSNVTDTSNWHGEKQDVQSTSTDAGTIILFIPLSVNANSSIRCNFESDSNVTDTSDSESEKQCFGS
jgi:hypothetical protein